MSSFQNRVICISITDIYYEQDLKFLKKKKRKKKKKRTHACKWEMWILMNEQNI